MLATVAANSPAGSYAINIGGAIDPNYNISYIGGTLTINPAALTLTADNQSQTYGGTQPALTYTASGLVNGDTTGSLTTQPVLATVTANSNAGNYPITIGGAADPNYTIAYVNGMLTINPAALTLTADNQSQTYGGVQPALTYTATGLVNGDTTASLGTQPVLATVAANSNAGNYPITIGGAADPNYTMSYVNGVLTINPAALTLMADNQSQTYGGTQPVLTYTATGLVNGDTTASLTTQPVLATAAANSNAGNYPITIGGAADPNYTISYVNGVLTINSVIASAIDVTPALTGSVIKTYDGTLFATLGPENYSLSGVATTDQNSVVLTVNGTPVTSPTTGMFSTKNVGAGLAVTVSGLALNQPASTDYALTTTTISGNIGTINPATLTYAANPAAATYGSSLPAFSGSVAGFVNGETLASATTGTASFSSTATASSNAGVYAINGSGLSAVNGNYVLVQASSNSTALTINPAALTISAVSATKVYDGTTASPQTPAYQIAGLAPNTLVGSDSFTTLFQTYNSKDVTTANTLSAGYQLADPGNYQVTIKTAPGSITARPLLLTGTRTYDGTTNAAANILTMVNLVAGDNVTLSGTGVLTGNGLTNANQTPGFASIGTLALSGSSASNYTLANITTPVVQGSQTLNTVYISFNGVSLSGSALKNANLSGLNLTGASLAGQNLNGVNLAGTNLSGANLNGANLKGATLTNADLAGATLTGANLSGDNLAGANLTGANLSGSNLSGDDLINAILVDANLSLANLSNANLTGANLTGANLTGTNLHGATR